MQPYLAVCSVGTGDIVIRPGPVSTIIIPYSTHYWSAVVVCKILYATGPSYLAHSRRWHRPARGFGPVHRTILSVKQNPDKNSTPSLGPSTRRQPLCSSQSSSIFSSLLPRSQPHSAHSASSASSNLPTATMAYSDTDKLAINTIRLLAVSSCPSTPPSEPLPRHRDHKPQLLLRPPPQCARDVLTAPSAGRCYLQTQLRSPRRPNVGVPRPILLVRPSVADSSSQGPGSSCPRPVQSHHDIQPQECKLGQSRQIRSLVSLQFSDFSTPSSNFRCLMASVVSHHRLAQP